MASAPGKPLNSPYITTSASSPSRNSPTNSAEEAQLWMVEKMFRTVKTLLETRPIFRKCDETIRGHVFCSFLALLLGQAGSGTCPRQFPR
jgi:hypothetical protein